MVNVKKLKQKDHIIPWKVSWKLSKFYSEITYAKYDFKMLDSRYIFSILKNFCIFSIVPEKYNINNAFLTYAPF